MGKGRAPCCDKSKVKRGPWSPAEDMRLIVFIQKHGHENWRSLPKQAGLLRCGKSCRLRWINYLRPDVKRGNFTKEEEDTILRLHQTLGNKWSKIASHLPGRTDNEIKNMWNTHLKKRLTVVENSADNGIANPPPQAQGEGDESKECSNTTTSSSSCSTSVVSSPRKTSLELLDHQATQKPETIMFSSSDDDFPLESDLDFWSMLDSLGPFQSDNEAADQLNEGQMQSSDFETANWLHYLENELALD